MLLAFAMEHVDGIIWAGAAAALVFKAGTKGPAFVRELRIDARMPEVARQLVAVARNRDFAGFAGWAMVHVVSQRGVDSVSRSFVEAGAALAASQGPAPISLRRLYLDSAIKKLNDLAAVLAMGGTMRADILLPVAMIWQRTALDMRTETQALTS